MTIGLFGGVFNPPHFGHVMIARQVLDFTDVERIWFLPNWGQSFAKPAAPAADRVAMTRLIEFPGSGVSTLEVDNRLDGRTINLLPHLPPGHTYRFIIGADQLPVFHKWARHGELLNRISFVVFPRIGYDMAPMYPNMTAVKHPFLMATDISSTKIRERVRAGLPVDDFVPFKVARYIREHGLYV